MSDPDFPELEGLPPDCTDIELQVSRELAEGSAVIGKLYEVARGSRVDMVTDDEQTPHVSLRLGSDPKTKQDRWYWSSPYGKCGITVPGYCDKYGQHLGDDGEVRFYVPISFWVEHILTRGGLETPEIVRGMTGTDLWDIRYTPPKLLAKYEAAGAVVRDPNNDPLWYIQAPGVFVLTPPIRAMAVYPPGQA